MHQGVLYIEKSDNPFFGTFEQYLKVCVKSTKRIVIASNSLYDGMYKGIEFMGKGTYKASYKGAKDFAVLKLNLQHYKESKVERITLFKGNDTSSFEFYGEVQRGQEKIGDIRAYYKGIEAYELEGCASYLGQY
ncbi:hypothetical protein JL49_22235 [Pseudoalteromonas luteoviolacea]|nr:hypothetical protein JL49_22235 [Pseudoalteromonas luteoviolacea]